MPRRRVFYSFHYEADVTRVAKIRNIGAIESNRPATDNGWEQVKRGGPPAIKRWINSEMRERTCAVVLIGEQTANRKWINYEIRKAWETGMGVVGVHIHNLSALRPTPRIVFAPPAQKALKGRNPFDFVSLPLTKRATARAGGLFGALSIPPPPQPTILGGLGARPSGRSTLLGGLASSASQQLSSVVKVYDPPGADSKTVYGFISFGLAAWIEEAIRIRKRYV